MNTMHPAREELVAWLTGTLDSDRIHTIETHVNQCDQCVAALDAIDQSCNPMQQRVRDAFQMTLEGDETTGVQIQAFTRTLDPEQMDATIDLGIGMPGVPLANLPRLNDGRYDVRDVIARGGMGEVRLAKDNAIRRFVAMKVILAESNNENRTSRFIEEAQITGQLEHPGIVPVHEMGVAPDGNLFYTMKRIHGRTLKDVLKAIRDQEPQTLQDFPLVRLLGILERVCDAIAFAHSKGVIHRDIKPENIMVGDYGEVLVVDWGLAKVIASESSEEEAGHLKSPTDELMIESVRQQSDGGVELTMEGSILGTPAFMSPEQASGQLDRIDRRTDIYGIGAVLYNILALRPPVVANSLGDLIRNVREGVITNPSACETIPNGWIVPSSLALVCMKALAKSPEERYQTVREFSSEVQAYRGGYATSVENAGFLKQSQLLVKRHRGITTSVAAAILLGIVGTAVYLHRINDALDRAQQSNLKANRALAKAEVAESVAEQEKQSAIRQLGKTQIALAETAYLSGDGLRAKNYLKACPDTVRGTHWQYLTHHSDPALYHKEFGSVRGISADPIHPDRFYLLRQSGELMYCEGRTGQVIGSVNIGDGFAQMAVSPDGKRIVTIPRVENRKCALLSTHPLEVLNRFEVPFQNGLQICFSNDSRTVFTSGFQQTLQIDSLEGSYKTLQEVFQSKVCFRRQPVVLGYRRETVVAINYETNEELWSVPSVGLVTRMAASFDDSLVLTCSKDGEFAVLDGKTGMVRRSFRGFKSNKLYYPKLIGSAKSHHVMALGHDADRKSLKIWNLMQESNQPSRSLCCTAGDPLQFGWNPLSNTVMEGFRSVSAYAVPDDSMTRLRRTVSGNSLAVVDEQNALVYSAASHRPELRDFRTGKVKQVWKSEDARMGFASSYDRNRTIFFDRRHIHHWSPSGVTRYRCDDSINLHGIHHATVAPDATLFSIGSEFPNITVVQPTGDGRLERVFSYDRDPQKYLLGGETKQMFPAGDKRTLLVSFAPRDDSGTRRDYFVFDIESNQLVAERTEQDASVAMQLDPTGQTLCVGATDGTLRGYDARNLDHRYTVRAHDRKITAISFRPDGKVLASGDGDGLIRFWRMENDVPTVQDRELVGNLSFVQALQFSPSGQQLVSLSGAVLYRWQETVSASDQENK